MKLKDYETEVEFQRDFLTKKDGGTDPLESEYEDLIDEASLTNI